MQYQGLIFDFDGLIMDSEWPAFAAWSAIFERHGVKLELEKWVQCVGTFGGKFDPVEHLCELTGVEVDGEALFSEKQMQKAVMCNSLGPMPGVIERLEEANSLGWRVAVASSSDRSWVVEHLERLGILKHFSVVVTRDDVNKVKPDPEPYLKAASRMELEPMQCVVLEDSLNGVVAAKAAGMYCVAVPNRITGLLDFSQADHVVKSLSELMLSELGSTST